MKLIRKCILIIILLSVLSPLRAEELDQDSPKFWRSVFVNNVESFDYYTQEIDQLILNIYSTLRDFKENTLEYDIKYHELRFIMTSVVDNPYESRLIIHEMNNLSASYKTIYKQLVSLDDSVLTYIETLNSMEKDLIYLSSKKTPSPEIIASANNIILDIRILRAHLKFEKKELKDSLDSIKEPMKNLANLNNFLKQSLKKQLETYFLMPGTKLWQIEWTNMLSSSIDKWIMTLPVSIKVRIPDTAKEYAYIGGIFLALLIFYFIISIKVIDKIKHKREMPEIFNLFKKSFLAILIALGFFIPPTFLIFPEDIILQHLAVIAFGFSAWYFTKGIILIISPEYQNNNYLLALFIMFCSGIFFQMLALNYFLFLLAWPATIFISSSILFIKPKEKVHYKEKRIIACFLLLFAILIVLAINGYIYLSVFLSMLSFLCLVIYRIGLTVNWFIKQSLEKAESLGSFGKGLIAGIGIPLVWLLLTAGIFIWASWQVTASPYNLYNYIDHLDINIESYNIRVSNLMILIFVFFVFKSFIKNFNLHLSYSPLAKKQSRHNIIPSLQNLTAYICWSIYIIIILITFRVNLTSIMVVLGGLSVGIGFGLQHIINNFVSGIILMFGKTCRTGDIVDIDNTRGTVIKTDIRTTVIKTFENCIITVPNYILIDKVLYNWTSNNDLVRLDLSVGVEYGSDVELVKSILLDIASEMEGVCKKPEPYIIFDEFGDNSLIFKLRYWIHKIDDIVSIPSELRFEINKAFKDAGINIAFPQLDLRIKDSSPAILKSQHIK